MEVIIAALIAGASAAAKDTVGNAIKDSYTGLKELIKGKFKADALGKAMVDAKLKLSQVDIDQLPCETHSFV